MSSANKNERLTVLQLFQKIHEESNFGSNSFSLTNPKPVSETIKEVQQEKHSPDTATGRTWIPAMVINNIESKTRDATIGDKNLKGTHKLVYTATGDRSIVVRCLVPGNVLRHPTSIDDSIIEQYPKFTCDINTLNSIPPVGSILMVMWNDKNIRKGGIILGYAVGGQKQKDDYTIFATTDGCGEVVPNKMKTTHAIGETLPAENVTKEVELKLQKVEDDSKQRPEESTTVAEPNSTWKTTNTPASGSVAEPETEKKKTVTQGNETATAPAETPNTIQQEEDEVGEIVCNKSYTVGDATEAVNDRPNTENLPPTSSDITTPTDPEKCKIEKIANEAKMPPRLMMAIKKIEVGQRGARSMRFEAHIFLGIAAMSNVYYPKPRKGRPDLRGKISYTPRANNKEESKIWYISRLRNESNRAAFNKAFDLDPAIAMQSTSYGKFQIMGHILLRMYNFDPIKAQAEFDKDPDTHSDKMFITFIKRNGRLRRTIEAGQKTGNYDFERIGRLYNGDKRPITDPNSYSAKLKEAYDQLGEVDTFCGENVPKENPRPQLPALVPPAPSDDAIYLDVWRSTSWPKKGKKVGKARAKAIVLDGPLGPPGTNSKVDADLSGPLRRMLDAYKREFPNGPALTINSAYRTYESQYALREKNAKPATRREYERRGGKATAAGRKYIAELAPQKGNFKPLTSAPGTSNHNQGRAIDFNSRAARGSSQEATKEDQFYRKDGARYNNSPPGARRDQRDRKPANLRVPQPYKWLCENAHRFGFIRTVKSERWHWVFIGESAPGRRYSKIKKSHGSWDGLFGSVPKSEAARRRRIAQARRGGGQ